MLRGGICGSATKATPESPKSARHTAFQVASAFGSLAAQSAPIFRAVAVTMDSIMKPVLSTPTGTGLGPTGGMAMQTAPTPKISGNALFRCLRSTVTKLARIGEPFDVADRADPAGTRNSIMEKTNGNSTKPSNT